ncbi:MAG: hypothetical protein ACR2OZ_08170 [Verrucomicrobiales bacterium]
MKPHVFWTCSALTCAALSVSRAQVASVPPSPPPVAAPPLGPKPEGSPAEGATPAQVKIAAAREAIQTNPANFQGYNSLALALTRRARETGNPEFYDQAAVALQESFKLLPHNLEGERVEVWILLGKHDFGQALEKARALNKRVPDDTMVYALLTDAAVEMGLYEEAEKAVQWIFDMRPGDIAGVTRGAYLRELFGDHEGALDLMQSAYDKVAPAEVEDRAWILTQLAHLQLLTGKSQIAEKLLEQSLLLFSKYHYALSTLAKVRTAQKRHAEAVSILQDVYLASPLSENLLALAEAQKRAGQTKGAEAAFKHFEVKALEESMGLHNHDRELVFYLVDHAHKPAEALQIAEKLLQRRQDVHTLHAAAWACHANQKYAEARQHIEKALAVGIREPVLLYHAGMIAAASGDGPAAERHFKAAISQAPDSEGADLALKALAQRASAATAVQ